MKLDSPDGVIHHFLLDVDNRLSDLTLVSYTHHLGVLMQLLHDVDNVTELEQVTVLHLRQCVQHLLNNPVEVKGRVPESGNNMLSVSTVNGYIRVWKAFFNWCYQEELIGTNPSARLKFPKAPKKVTSTFTQEHIEKMLSICDTHTDIGFRNYVILLLLLDTGMRVSELAGLQVENVNLCD